MKFKMSSEWWLVFCIMSYVVAIMIAMFAYHIVFDDPTIMYIQLVWLFVMSLPLFIKPLARVCGTKVIWEE